ncbi:polycomb group protein Psc-like [Mercenaria mercenaria]|uniref:polycomb group protein Psc-like n=1 Tax=Mercenaria mercenaria TaxID=6596 RepID=UPI00234F631E|nr:polycomb group protein Psc-like [Mercenaria mercenaria]XP_053373745.1 polycomb group protein Psc-like [Mercenaria mercenaria]
MTESCPKKTNIAEISPHLICALCGGYLIDATTIVECLHSFCKTCIVRYLESSKYCPICEVLVHKTRPLQNIRLDHTLQDIVYKLVPGLFQSEMKRRREFYKDHQTVRSAKVRQEQQRHRVIYSADEQFSIALEFCPDGRIRRPSGRRSRRTSKQEIPERRYLLCPAGTTVALLKKFMKLKFALPPKFKVDIFHGNGPLRDHYSMMDVAYIYSWKREGVLQLYYSVYKVPDPVPEIRITEVKDEKCFDNADETGQKADDTRPSILFNKATLLGNHSVDRNIPHDLSPLELIATVANDICIQEGRGLKRKPEDAQLYENDEDASSTETRQLQKSIEHAIDLCSNSNQGSPARSSSINTTVSTTSVQDTRTGNQATVSEVNSVSVANGNGDSVTIVGSENSIRKSSITQKSNEKNIIAKEKPKKMDTASQCDPRPKKHKGEGHLHNKSKNSNKTQSSNKDGKAVSSISNTEKKPNVKSETKSNEKSVPLKTNGVNIVEQNGAALKSSDTHVGGKVSDTQKAEETKRETVKEQKPGPKVINTLNKETNSQTKNENDVPKSLAPTLSSASEVTPSNTSAPNRTSSTVTKPSSAPSDVKTSNTPPKTSSVPFPNKMSNSPNKQPSTSVTAKTPSKLTNAQTSSKVPASVLKSAPTPTKVTESVKPVTQINGHSSPAEIAKQQNKVSNVVKVNQNEKKD